MGMRKLIEHQFVFVCAAHRGRVSHKEVSVLQAHEMSPHGNPVVFPECDTRIVCAMVVQHVLKKCVIDISALGVAIVALVFWQSHLDARQQVFAVSLQRYVDIGPHVAICAAVHHPIALSAAPNAEEIDHIVISFSRVDEHHPSPIFFGAFGIRAFAARF